MIFWAQNFLIPPIVYYIMLSNTIKRINILPFCNIKTPYKKHMMHKNMIIFLMKIFSDTYSTYMDAYLKNIQFSRKFGSQHAHFSAYVDLLLLALIYHQNRVWNRKNRGRCGLGSYLQNDELKVNLKKDLLENVSD